MADFMLTITMGNDAMQTRHDIADALANVAQRMRDHQYDAGTRGHVRDVNGNSVGTFEFNHELREDAYGNHA